MDKFYLIKVINAAGRAGYLTKTPQGLMVYNKIVGETNRFKTFQDAQQFLRDNPEIEKKGTKAYILDNLDLIKEGADAGIMKVISDMFYLENDKGEKCFFNSEMQGYYFEKNDVGFCLWDDEERLKQLIQIFEEDHNKIFIKKLNNKKALN